MARLQTGFTTSKILEEKTGRNRRSQAFWVSRCQTLSHLMNGQSRFTTDKLLDFLRRLDGKVTIQESPRHKTTLLFEVENKLQLWQSIVYTRKLFPKAEGACSKTRRKVCGAEKLGKPVRY